MLFQGRALAGACFHNGAFLEQQNQNLEIPLSN